MAEAGDWWVEAGVNPNLVRHMAESEVLREIDYNLHRIAVHIANLSVLWEKLEDRADGQAGSTAALMVEVLERRYPFGTELDELAIGAGSYHEYFSSHLAKVEAALERLKGELAQEKED